MNFVLVCPNHVPQITSDEYFKDGHQFLSWLGSRENVNLHLRKTKLNALYCYNIYLHLLGQCT